MNDDGLRDRLARLDPISASDRVDPITSDRARALMEDIMDTSTTPKPATSRPVLRWATGFAIVAVALVGAALLRSPDATTTGPPMQLATPAGTQMMSCMPFDTAILADMSPAFEGTVTDVTGSVATLTVDHWYTGGDAATVEIQFQPGLEALIATPDFEVGSRYLITAADGVVNGCGYSGLATPELEAAFAEAFGS